MEQREDPRKRRRERRRQGLYWIGAAGLAVLVAAGGIRMGADGRMPTEGDGGLTVAADAAGGQVAAAEAEGQDGAGDGETVPAAHRGIIRFHVVANSDTARDQALKLQVRDRVLAALGRTAPALQNGRRLYTGAAELIMTRQYLQHHLEDIEAWATAALRAAGSQDGVQVRLGVTWIPEKTYDGLTFPAGNYEALTIVIGRGHGQNWWCVLFPPLCYIDCGSVQESRLAAVGSQRLLLRSKVAEMVQAWEQEQAQTREQNREHARGTTGTSRSVKRTKMGKRAAG